MMHAEKVSMTAITKRQKRMMKRGRPRIENVSRTSSGQISRAAEPVDELALKIRARQFNITVEQAKDQRAGSFLGYLYMIGRIDGISESQYEAAIMYQQLRRDYLSVVGAPDALRDNGVPGRPGDHVSDEYVEWAEKVKAKYLAARKAIQEAQNGTRTENLWAALDLIIVQDQRLHSLIGATRLVCNALSRFFRT